MKLTKAKLNKELKAALDKKAGGPKFNVPGFRQRSGGLNLAQEKQEWAVRWRQRLVDVFESENVEVAEAEKVEHWVRGFRTATKFNFTVFTVGNKRVAVLKANSAHPNNFRFLEDGETLKDLF